MTTFRCQSTPLLVSSKIALGAVCLLGLVTSAQARRQASAPPKPAPIRPAAQKTPLPPQNAVQTQAAGAGTTLGTAITQGTSGPAGAPGPVLTLDQVVALAVNNNSNVQLARQRLQKAQEQIVQVDAQGRPQVSANLIDTYSSQATFATSGVTVTSPALPGGGQIPVVTDQGGGNTGSFTGGGGGGTANSNGSFSSTGGTAIPAAGQPPGPALGLGGNSGAGTIGGRTGSGGTIGGGTGTGRLGGTGSGARAPAGTGTGGAGNRQVGDRNRGSTGTGGTTGASAFHGADRRACRRSCSSMRRPVGSSRRRKPDG